MCQRLSGNKSPALLGSQLPGSGMQDSLLLKGSPSLEGRSDGITLCSIPIVSLAGQENRVQACPDLSKVPLGLNSVLMAHCFLNWLSEG